MALSDSEIEDRVSRERSAHDARDVLAESYRLKERFHQVFEAPHIKRLEQTWQMALASVDGLDVLDYGCGRGAFGLELASRGARLTGIDISERYVAEANLAARGRAFSAEDAQFVAGDCHRTGFADNAFDLVVGEGILHHLDLERAAIEIHRVLRPGGVALFKEPLVGAPWMRLFRLLTPGARTPDEQPFREADLRMLGRLFHAQSSYYGILTPAAAGGLSLVAPRVRFTRLLMALDRLDQGLGQLEAARSWHQYVLLRLVKQSAAPAVLA